MASICSYCGNYGTSPANVAFALPPPYLSQLAASLSTSQQVQNHCLSVSCCFPEPKIMHSGQLTCVRLNPQPTPKIQDTLKSPAQNDPSGAVHLVSRKAQKDQKECEQCGCFSLNMCGQRLPHVLRALPTGTCGPAPAGEVLRIIIISNALPCTASKCMFVSQPLVSN